MARGARDRQARRQHRQVAELNAQGMAQKQKNPLLVGF